MSCKWELVVERIVLDLKSLVLLQKVQCDGSGVTDCSGVDSGLRQAGQCEQTAWKHQPNSSRTREGNETL